MGAPVADAPAVTVQASPRDDDGKDSGRYLKDSYNRPVHAGGTAKRVLIKGGNKYGRQ